MRADASSVVDGLDRLSDTHVVGFLDGHRFFPPVDCLKNALIVRCELAELAADPIVLGGERPHMIIRRFDLIDSRIKIHLQGRVCLSQRRDVALQIDQLRLLRLDVCVLSAHCVGQIVVAGLRSLDVPRELRAFFVDNTAVVVQISNLDSQAFIGGLKPGKIFFRGIQRRRLRDKILCQGVDPLLDVADLLKPSHQSEINLLDMLDLIVRILILGLKDAAKSGQLSC